MQKTHTIYFGTSTGTPDSGIYRGTLNGQNGQLGNVELIAQAKNPAFLALSPDNSYLYAVLDTGGSDAGSSAVGAWAIEANGALRFLNSQPSGGASACHLVVDASGKNVLVANYGGGSIACFPTRADGSLGEASAIIQHRGHGPNPHRQEAPHAHSIYVDETNERVYVCDLGTDEVKIYAFDAARGALISDAVPSAPMPAGGGPRHMAFHPAGFVYVNNEMGLSITACERDRDSGALKALQIIATVPSDAPIGGVSTAEIALHPLGRALYASNRGRDTIAVFAVAEDGYLTWIEEKSTPAEPRSFAVSPDGHWLVVAGQKGHQVAAFKIQPESGKLEETGKSIDLESVTCVLFSSL